MSLNEPLLKFAEVLTSLPTRKEVKKGALYIGKYKLKRLFQ